MEEILKSQSLQATKTTRAVIKGSVTKIAKKLKTSLALETGQKYDFATINKVAILEEYNKLKSNLIALTNS